MKYSPRILLALAAILAATLGAACKKASAPAETAAGQPAAPAAAGQQSTSAEVMAAIDKKDYDTAVGLIGKAKQAASNPADEAAVANLIDDAKIKLIEAAPSDPKAAEALAAVRALAGGR